MSLLSLLAISVLAAETVVSPLPDDSAPTPLPQPAVSFGQLTTPPLSPAGQVLGSTSENPAPQPSIALPAVRKKQFTIALLGDSMVDTLGADIPHLQGRLAALIPGVSFRLLNYGVGASNIDSGRERLANDYTYLGQHQPALLSQRPDIIVVESFGYNPYSFNEGALNKHWLKLAEIVTSISQQLPQAKVVIAATIAPDANTFGDGAPGVSFDFIAKRERTDVIKQYLENAVRFARGEHLPLADAFHASLDENGNGRAIFISEGDHIHPSDAGRELFAQKVANAIADYRLLE